MSSDGRFDVEFNEMLDGKIENLMELPVEAIRDGLKELRILLQQRNERRRLGLTDEISLMPPEMRCAVFREYDNLDLIDTIIALYFSGQELESTAGYVLQQRKFEASLRVYPDEPDDVYRELHMQCEMWKRDKVYAGDAVEFRILKKLRCSTEAFMSDYFCGFLRVILLFMTVTARGQIYLAEIGCSKIDAEDYFGAPENDVSKKRACGNLLIASRGEVFAPLLQWIHPSEIIYNADPQLLFDTKRELTIKGVDTVQLGDAWSEIGDVNDVMTKCEATTIRLGPCAFWSHTSFNAVLTAHANSGETGKARQIQIIRLPNEHSATADEETLDELTFIGWSADVWIQRYNNWRTGHVAEYGEPGREIKYETEKEQRSQRYSFKLILH